MQFNLAVERKISQTASWRTVSGIFARPASLLKADHNGPAARRLRLSFK